MRQHLDARLRARRQQRVGARVTTVGLAAILAAATTVPAPSGALPVRPPLGTPFRGGQRACTIHVVYLHVGTLRDDSLHVPAHIRASVTDVRGTHTDWGAQIEVPALGLGAQVDIEGHADLAIRSAKLAGRDSVAVTVRGLGHRPETVPVRLTPGTVATITAALCLTPNDGPMAMQLVTTNARPGVACQMFLSQPDPSSRVRDGDITTPAVIRATITDTAGAPVDQAMVMLAIYRGRAATHPATYTDSRGYAVLAVPGEQLANADSLVVHARRIGFEPQHLSVRIVPGDTVTMRATLCPGTQILSEFTGVRPRECRDADSEAVRVVHRFITEHQAFQTEHHITPIDSATVRLMTDARDAKVCHASRDALSSGDGPATYISAGAYYFVIVPRRRVRSAEGGWYFPEWRPIAVFDRALHFIGAEGM